MSTIITEQYEHWCANQVISDKPARPDTFVFACIPDQDENAEISRDEGMPDDALIQYRVPVTQYGLLSPNAVAFSVILDTTVGDFDYNWIGLLNEESGVLCMIAHTPYQQKIRTANGVQGNNLIRTFSMEFNGAAAAMQVDVSADVWQIDFTARLAGMDESRRLLALDHYGEAAFLADGFRVTYEDGLATVAPGVGYVGGLRVQLREPYTLPAEPDDTLWLDASWQGFVTGEWGTVFTLSARTEHTSYTDEKGFRHFVAPLATLTDGEAEDLRPQTPDEQMSDALAEHEKSRRHPDATLTDKGFTQLCNATDSDSEELAATPKAVKAAYDNAEARLEKDQNGNDIPDKDTFVKNAGAARAFSGSINIGGDNGNWTTAEFIEWLDTQGAFNHPHWMCKGSWSYASNKIITDTGCGNIQLAGAVVEVMGVKSAMTIRITTPTTVTNGTAKAQFTYINHGDSYSPGWRRDWDRGGDTMTGELVSTSANAFRLVGGNYGAFWRNDGGSVYLLLTDNGDQYGSWNSLRPLIISLNTGKVTMGHSLAVSGTVTPTDYSNFDSRYLLASGGVSAVRLGEAVSIGKGGNASSGYLVSGVDGGESVDWVNARPVQYYINGTWITAESI
ncbi:TPA: phage tail protein [Escherichia coli]|nr:phage tail protein [Escherichia coli]MED9700699.1 phage tail protein [Escherichia coli]HAY0227942.1 phage tail protein [Escherichia coli]HEL8019934.1 phage tail protein [Escherichia coli]HEL8086203.1 phage tail protein [Escherichia coli]